MNRIVLLRHGQSQWNLENRFTGWTDVNLTKQGQEEARSAGDLLINNGFMFDSVYTSLLVRANQTMEICLEEMGIDDIPIYYDWRLNERHYGALQGLNKAETAKEYGDDQVLIWRRSYDISPPKLKLSDERHPRFDERYAALEPTSLPASECLKDTVDRFLPLWDKTIKEDVASGQRVLVVAHGNSLRALVKYLDDVSDEDIIGINIPTGVPLVYELDDKLKPIRHYYLGDKDEIAKKAAAVAAQGSAK